MFVAGYVTRQRPMKFIGAVVKEIFLPLPSGAGRWNENSTTCLELDPGAPASAVPGNWICSGDNEDVDNLNVPTTRRLLQAELQ